MREVAVAAEMEAMPEAVGDVVLVYHIIADGGRRVGIMDVH